MFNCQIVTYLIIQILVNLKIKVMEQKSKFIKKGGIYLQFY